MNHQPTAPVAGETPQSLAEALQDEIALARRDAQDDPFGNPVLRVTLWLTRRMDRGELTTRQALDLVRHLGRQALVARAGRTAAYVGLTPDPEAALGAIARRLVDAAFARKNPSRSSPPAWSGCALPRCSRPIRPSA